MDTLDAPLDPPASSELQCRALAIFRGTGRSRRFELRAASQGLKPARATLHLVRPNEKRED
jgi:hypothetical protein